MRSEWPSLLYPSVSGERLGGVHGVSGGGVWSGEGEWQSHVEEEDKFASYQFSTRISRNLMLTTNSFRNIERDRYRTKGDFVNHKSLVFYIVHRRIKTHLISTRMFFIFDMNLFSHFCNPQQHKSPATKNIQAENYCV